MVITRVGRVKTSLQLVIIFCPSLGNCKWAGMMQSVYLSYNQCWLDLEPDDLLPGLTNKLGWLHCFGK